MLRLQAAAGDDFDKPVVPKQIALLSVVVNTPRIKSTFKLSNAIGRAKAKFQFLQCPPITFNECVRQVGKS